MHFWVPVAIAGIAAGVVVFAYIVTARRERVTSRREAAAKYRLAFAESMTQLDNNIDAHSLVNEARTNHDAAILEFRPSVALEQLEHFDAAVQNFHRYRSELLPAPAKVLASLESGKPADNSDTFKLKEALNELVAFANDS